MAKLTLSNITSGYATNTAVNANNDLIETAIENTLSRDGTAPNTMNTSIDMNGFNILNQGNPITVSGLVWEGPWLTAISYTIGDIVEYNGTAYIAIVTHTSGVFATDLSNLKWQLFTQANLPTQTGNNGKVLGTDGTTASWSTVELKAFTPAGTGAVVTTIQNKLRQTVNVTDFGVIGNSTTGDDLVFQAAIDYLHKLSDDTGVQGTLEFEGSIYLNSPKLFGKNIHLKGKGRGFKSVIKPLASFSGSYLFGIDGNQCIGGNAFRIRHENFTIDNSLITTKAQLAKTYYINNAYDISFDDVWIYNFRGTAVEITASNLIIINNISIYGVTADAAHSEYGIRCLTSGSGGGVKIINPDIEVCFKGLSQESNSLVEIINPYCERNIIGWQGIGTTSGALTVIGGQIASPGASGTAAYIAGNNITVIGGKYQATGGNGLLINTSIKYANINIFGATGDIEDTKNYANKVITESVGRYLSIVSNYKTPADTTATTFFDIVCPFVASYFGICEVTVNARDNSGFSLWTGKYRFALSNPSGTLIATPVIEYAKTNLNFSANYSLAVTCALNIVGTTASFQITTDTGGVLGNGLTSRVSAQAELIQWDSSGSLYIQAV